MTNARSSIKRRMHPRVCVYAASKSAHLSGDLRLCQRHDASRAHATMTRSNGITLALATRALPVSDD